MILISGGEVHFFVKVKELSQFCHNKVICQTSVVAENSFRTVLKEKILLKQRYVYVHRWLVCSTLFCLLKSHFSFTEPEHWKHVHNGAAETVEISSPELSIDIPNICELPLTSLNWEDVKLPVDIVLFTEEDDEFLSCFAHLKKPERSYHISVGFVYFGFMEDNWGHKIETALMRCSKGHDGPGGALSAAKDAILLLRPKALISVGACRGLNSTKVKLGDIVVSSKLITPAFQIPPKRNMNKVIRNIADGWKPPLKNANGYKPKVHLGALLSISEANKDIISRYPEAIGVEEEAGGENHNNYKDEPGTFQQCIKFPFLFEHVACGK